MYRLKSVHILAVYFFLCGLVPSFVQDISGPALGNQSRARSKLTQAVTSLASLEQSRAAGLMNSGEFASRVRKEIIPLVNAGDDERKKQEIETLALIYEAKERLAESERMLGRKDFARTISALDEFWTLSRPALLKQITQLQDTSATTVEGLTNDLTRFSNLAARMEVLMCERHLSLLKVTYLSPHRDLANVMIQQKNPDSFAETTRLLLKRLEYVEEIHPAGEVAELREKMQKVDRALCHQSPLC